VSRAVGGSKAAVSSDQSSLRQRKPATLAGFFVLGDRNPGRAPREFFVVSCPSIRSEQFYPDIRVVDVWGILTVSKGALINSTFSKVYNSAPSGLSSSPIQGDGWTLELNPGWTMTAGERKGDYVVKKR